MSYPTPHEARPYRSSITSAAAVHATVRLINVATRCTATSPTWATQARVHSFKQSLCLKRLLEEVRAADNCAAHDSGSQKIDALHCSGAKEGAPRVNSPRGMRLAAHSQAKGDEKAACCAAAWLWSAHALAYAPPTSPGTGGRCCCNMGLPATCTNGQRCILAWYAVQAAPAWARSAHLLPRHSLRPRARAAFPTHDDTLLARPSLSSKSWLCADHAGIPLFQTNPVPTAAPLSPHADHMHVHEKAAAAHPSCVQAHAPAHCTSGSGRAAPRSKTPRLSTPRRLGQRVLLPLPRRPGPPPLRPPPLVLEALEGRRPEAAGHQLHAHAQ